MAAAVLVELSESLFMPIGGRRVFLLAFFSCAGSETFVLLLLDEKGLSTISENLWESFRGAFGQID